MATKDDHDTCADSCRCLVSGTRRSSLACLFEPFESGEIQSPYIIHALFLLEHFLLSVLSWVACSTALLQAENNSLGTMGEIRGDSSADTHAVFRMLHNQYWHCDGASKWSTWLRPPKMISLFVSGSITAQWSLLATGTLSPVASCSFHSIVSVLITYSSAVFLPVLVMTPPNK